ncbi:hypothetical protein T440DRAFT_502829 [Plenodomus tracheiphilus IPT5]|uniref:Ubiquitin 3 binding protein But2 C-terminal domain-containing protein n=1 Tax=Plenodomus tracheiphilus IPT5 TaxID=1408161 RepID=A0A6A7ANZ9_9PLEO|nr:hypothetical protein T440DRAFT_502829 [Plenodomus tracheiphilus IPT5]
MHIPPPLVFALLPLPLTLAAPPNPPHITTLSTSGTGCPSTSSSVHADSQVLSDTTSFTFTALAGDSTDNCALHIQSAGGSAGWQVAVREVGYTGDVVLKGDSSLDVITQVFWSERAGETATLTSSLPCTGPSLSASVTLRSTTSDLKWSKCTTSDGNPGILNVNFRPVVQGESGTYAFKKGVWGLVWRTYAEIIRYVYRMPPNARSKQVPHKRDRGETESAASNNKK